MTNPMTGPDAATGQMPEPVMRRFRVAGSPRTGRWYVLDCVSDEYVSGSMNKRGAEMLADKLQRALSVGDGATDGGAG